MLNRAKKNLIIAITGLLLALPAFALDSTISYITINGMAYQDVEIVITEQAEILVPFKQLADLFDIQYNANRVDKFIGFKTFDGKEGVINQKGVFVQDAPISKKSVFVSQGIMDGVFNEAYITAEAASKIMGVKLDSDFETLTIAAEVTRDIPLLKNLNNVVAAEDKGPHAYQDVVAPKKSGKITLNTIGLRSNLLNDNMAIRGMNYRTDNSTFSGSTQASLNGNIWGGKYRVEATEYHYKSDAFMFGGLTGSYMNSIKDKKTGKDKYFYELGKVKGRTDVDASIGTNIFGAQVWNYNYRKGLNWKKLMKMEPLN